jgi:hypothetical protein
LRVRWPVARLVRARARRSRGVLARADALGVYARTDAPARSSGVGVCSSAPA